MKLLSLIAVSDMQVELYCNVGESRISPICKHRRICYSYRMFSKIACIHCKSNKRRCDRKLPTCTLCASKQRQCNYPEKDHRRPATRKYIDTLLDRINVLESSLKHHKLLEANYPTADELKAESQINSLNQISASVPHDLSILQFFEANEDDYSKGRTNGNFPPSTSMTANEIGLGLPRWQLNISDDGEVSCRGPSSLRFVSISNNQQVKTFPVTVAVPLFDEFHQEVFAWFFKCINNSLPLVDEHLFMSSLNEAIDGDELGEYSPMALINTIMTFYFLYQGKKQEAADFKILAVRQLENLAETNPNLSTIQTLVLLSQISMLDGNEFQSSQFIARATAASYHLGLHVTAEKLVARGKVSPEEARLRDNVFWSCFLVDRIRCIIVGMHPYMNCTDISISLPEAAANVIGFNEYETFKESLLFHNLEVALSERCFSAANSFGIVDKPIETLTLQQKIAVSEASVSINRWKKDMSSEARFINNKSINAMQLQVSILTTSILFNKTLMKEPVIGDHTQGGHNSDPQMIALSCFRWAQEIIKLCSEYELSETLFLYKFIYSIFLSCFICLYNMTSPSPRIKKVSTTFAVKAIKLLKEYQVYATVVDTYLDHLNKFRQAWFASATELQEYF